MRRGRPVRFRGRGTTSLTTVAENLEILDELLFRALAVLIAITDWLTAIGFLVTFVAVVVAGAWMLIRGLVVRLRSLAATYRR